MDQAVADAEQRQRNQRRSWGQQRAHDVEEQEDRGNAADEWEQPQCVFATAEGVNREPLDKQESRGRRLVEAEPPEQPGHGLIDDVQGQQRLVVPQRTISCVFANPQRDPDRDCDRYEQSVCSSLATEMSRSRSGDRFRRGAAASFPNSCRSIHAHVTILTGQSASSHRHDLAAQLSGRSFWGHRPMLAGVRPTAPDPAQPCCSATEDALIDAPSTDEIGSPTDVVIFLDGVADPTHRGSHSRPCAVTVEGKGTSPGG